MVGQACFTGKLMKAFTVNAPLQQVDMVTHELLSGQGFRHLYRFEREELDIGVVVYQTQLISSSERIGELRLSDLDGMRNSAKSLVRRSIPYA